MGVVPADLTAGRSAATTTPRSSARQALGFDAALVVGGGDLMLHDRRAAA